MYKKILITILSLLCLCSNPVYAEDVIEQPVAPPIETVVETKDGEDNTITVEEPKTEVDTAQGETEEVNKEDTVEDDNTSDSVQVENKDENTDLTENTTDDPALLEERIDNGTYATTAGTNTTQEKSTEVSYAIEESYEWTIHSAIDFGTDSNDKTVSKGNRVNVSKNVLMKGNKLVIKVKGSGTNNAFTISNGNGETLSYTVGDGSKTFNANDVILELQAGTNEGYKDLEFNLDTSNKSKYAGAYTGTVSYTAEIEQPVISKTDSFVGYYADTNGDGTVDGIIFADLAVGGSGTWNPSGESWANSTGTYSYGTIPADELKDYVISEGKYSGKFGEKPIVKAVGNGKDRFYVMALKNIDSSTYTWYANAYNNGMTDYASTTSPNFGVGKANTATMINKWNNQAYGPQNTRDGYKDLWGKVSAGSWFVPSKMEWATFAGELGVTKANYSSLGLSSWYWSSSQHSSTTAWIANFRRGYVNDNLAHSNNCVRLATTF